MSRPNNSGLTSFDVCNINTLYLAGERFQNLDQAEMDLIIANLGSITSNATKITALEASDASQNTAISGLQASDASQNTAIATLQTSDISQNTAIATLQATDASFNSKLQYWNTSGTIYNNTGGNGGISALTAQTAVVIAGSNNSFMQVGGSSGISIEGGSNGLYLSSTNDVIIDTKDSSKNIRIGMNTNGGYGNSTIDVGGGGSLIRIGNEQTTVAIPPANGPVIYIGQKNNVKSDSTTHLQGNFLLDKAQFTDLNGSSAITWEQLGALIPTVGIPAFCLSFILTSSIPNFVYSDLWAMKATAFQKLGEAETVISPKCKSLVIFNSELLTVTEPALKVFTLRGTTSISTLEGDNNLYSFLGKNVIRADGGGVISGRIDDGDFNSIITDSSNVQVNCSYGNLELVAMGDANIDFYAGSNVRNIHKKSTMSVKNDRRILMSYDSNSKTPTTDARLTIKNGVNVLGTPQETNLLALEDLSGNVISTLNASNISNQSLTLQSGYAGTTTATLYKDNSNNLFWNGTQINNQTPNISLANVLLTANSAGSTPINMNGNPIQNASDILPQANNDLVVGSKASSTGKTYIYANAQPRITVSNSGNVGIGSANTAPNYLLDASGGAVNCSELRINGVTQTFGGSQNLSSVLSNGASANSIGITNLDNVSGSNNADVFYAATGTGQLSLNAAGSTKLRVSSNGITATSTLNMNNNNITGANTITAGTFTGGSGGKIVCDPTADTTTIGKYLTPANGSGYTLYTSNLLCDSNIVANGYYLTGGIAFKPVEWDWQGVQKATSSSTYFVKWDSNLESLPNMSLAYDWELELRFSNYLSAYSYIGLLLNGDTATNEQVKTSHWGHEFQMWANTSAVQVFTTNIAFSKCFPKNQDYNDFIYRLRLCWDSRNNVLVNYVQGVCYRWYNGLSTGATDYETSHGVQVIHNTAYLTESGGETPSINSIRFQSWTTTQDIFRRATLKVKRVAKRWS